MKQSLAIAYAMKKKAKKCDEGYADGGYVSEEKASGYRHMPEEHEKHDHAAMMEDDRMLNQHGEHEVGAEGMEEDNEHSNELRYVHPVEDQSDHEHMVSRIMKQRAMHYSKGGKVENKDEVIADFEPNEFDDLEKDDSLSPHYAGSNEHGDEEGEDYKHDLVSRAMLRRKKDRMPRPM